MFRDEVKLHFWITGEFVERNVSGGHDCLRLSTTPSCSIYMVRHCLLPQVEEYDSTLVDSNKCSR